MKKVYVIGIILLLVGVNVSGSYIKDTKVVSTVSFDGNTLYVGGSGSNNYTKIQDAIDNSSDGDTVYVYDDSSPYYECLVVDKTISIIGEDNNRPTLIGDRDGYYLTVFITADDVTFSNFIIQHVEPSYIYIYSADNVEFSNNLLNDPVYNFFYAYDCPGIQVFDNVFSNSWVGGIFFDSCSDSHISGNVFENILEGNSWQHAIVYINDSYNSKIHRNIFRNNSGHYKYYYLTMVNSDNPTITENIFENNDWNGIKIDRSNNSVIADNIFDNNSRCIQYRGRLHQITLDHNTFRKNRRACILSHGLWENGLYKHGIISNNTFLENYGCFTLHYMEQSILINNTMIKNNFSGVIEHGYNINIIENYIFNNIELGIQVYGSERIRIANNIITQIRGFGSEGGIKLGDSQDVNISYNIITNNSWGLYIRRCYNNISVYMNNIANNDVNIEIWNPDINMSNLLLSKDEGLIISKNNFERIRLIDIVNRFQQQYIKTTWVDNYWGRARILPKFIIVFGRITEKLFLPARLEFDLHPAKQPYDIPRLAI